VADPVLSATLSEQRAILLSWTYGSNADFQVFWKSNVPAGQEYVLLATTNAFSYTTADLEPSKIYYFYVRANVGATYFYSNVVELFVSCGKGVVLEPYPPPSPDPQPTSPGGCYAELDVFHDNFSNYIGVALRYDPSARVGYFMRVSQSDTFDIIRYNFPSTLGIGGGAWLDSHSIHRLRLECVGNPPVFTFYRDGVLLGTCMDTSGSTPYSSGYAAVYAAGGSGGAVSGGDNYVCGNITRWSAKIPIYSDDFNRADQELSVSPWLDLVGGDLPCRIRGNRVGATTSGQNNLSSYDNSLGVITP